VIVHSAYDSKLAFEDIYLEHHPHDALLDFARRDPVLILVGFEEGGFTSKKIKKVRKI